jgi:cytidylate kinase
LSLNPEFVRVIAIDGTSASGKSTLAQRLASRIGYFYFDTGVMYRAVTLAGIQAGIPASDEDRITKMASEISIDVRPPSKQDGRQYDVIVDGEDVTWEIRSEEVDANVSEVSAYSGVRQAMTERQREIGRRGNVIMVGRDIGTVVLPEADLKLYLDASVEARARRRYEERQARGEDVDYEEILDSMRTRDRIDSSRDVAPLRPADDAVTINTSNRSIEETLVLALKLIEE